jgi:hypothetical protein
MPRDGNWRTAHLEWHSLICLCDECMECDESITNCWGGSTPRIWIGNSEVLTTRMGRFERMMHP